MILKVRYFGMLAEAIAKNEEDIEVLVQKIKVFELVATIRNKYAELNKFNFKVAINETIVDNDFEIKEYDTIALLPPFAGG